MQSVTAYKRQAGQDLPTGLLQLLSTLPAVTCGCWQHQVGMGRFCTFCVHTLLWCQNQEHGHLRLSADFHMWSGAGRGQWSSLLHSGTFFASAHRELWAGEVSARGTLSAVFGVKATPSPGVTASNPGAAL